MEIEKSRAIFNEIESLTKFYNASKPFLNDFDRAQFKETIAIMVHRALGMCRKLVGTLQDS